MKNSRLRHSYDGAVEDIGLDRIHPVRSGETKCQAKDCPYASIEKLVTFGRRAMRTDLCWYHYRELQRLMKAQGSDWGRDGGRVGQARLYYASKRGFHAY